MLRCKIAAHDESARNFCNKCSDSVEGKAAGRFAAYAAAVIARAAEAALRVEAQPSLLQSPPRASGQAIDFSGQGFPIHRLSYEIVRARAEVILLTFKSDIRG